MTKICSVCKVEKPLTEFYSNGYQPSGAKKYKAKCKPCEELDRVQKQLEFILHTLEKLGRKFECERCGYKKNSAALCFHHKDPLIKDFGIATLGRTTRTGLAEEIAKCELLCSNCHMEEHYPHRMIDDEN